MLKNFLDEEQVIAIQIHANEIYLISTDRLKTALHDLNAIIARNPFLAEPKPFT